MYLNVDAELQTVNAGDATLTTLVGTGDNGDYEEIS